LSILASPLAGEVARASGSEGVMRRLFTPSVTAFGGDSSPARGEPSF